MNTGDTRLLAQRNRTTARRIVGAVLVFHSLALFSGYLVLDRALHPDLPVAVHAVQVSSRSVNPSAPTSAVAGATTSAAPSDAPAWIAAASSHDTAAPWRVDAQGHVHFENPGLNR